MSLVYCNKNTEYCLHPNANASCVLHIWKSLCRLVASKLQISLHNPAIIQKRMWWCQALSKCRLLLMWVVLPATAQACPNLRAKVVGSIVVDQSAAT
jgi:hypothetical protein